MIQFPFLEKIEKYFKSQTIVYWIWILIIGLSIGVGVNIKYWPMCLFGAAVWIIGAYPISLWEKKHKNKDGK
jgi:hypothetical protein